MQAASSRCTQRAAAASTARRANQAGAVSRWHGWHHRLLQRECAAAGEQPDTTSASQEQQQQQPPGYDPAAAAGFMPPPGEKPLWWVEKFEARRRQLAETAAAKSSSSSSQQGEAAAELAAAAPPAPAGARWLAAARQLLQLAAALAALMLWPATTVDGGLEVQRVWVLYAAYMAFFGGGSVYRMLAYGPLAERRRDAQGRTLASTASWALFVAAVPLIHWPPMRAFVARQVQAQAQHAAAGATLFDALGAALLCGAIALNWAAARHLGRAYDRLVAPASLVTSGPYAHIQHPIYSSYAMLFVGYALALHSAPAALLALSVCLIYYTGRARIEGGLLRDGFGQQYQDYASRVKHRFVPGLL